MQTMTQGRDGKTLAHRAALVRQLSVVIAVMSIVAIVATAGTSYAGRPHFHDTVVVSNFGVLFAGSVETFALGSTAFSKPTRKIIGPATLMGSANGAAGVAQSSSVVDQNEIAVAITAGLPVPPFVEVGGAEVSCPTDCHINAAGSCAPKTQFDCVTTASPGTVLTFTQGATGDSAPATVIDGGFAEILNNTFGGTILKNATGLFAPQGVAYNNPFIGDGGEGNGSPQEEPGSDILAVANLAPVVVGSTTDFITCGVTTLPTIGSITEYEFGDTGNIAPIPRENNAESDNTVFKVPVPPATVNPPNPPSDLPTPYFGNATIGGCNTFLFEPTGIAFDENNDLWVVNNGAAISATVVIPPFVSEFDPDAAFEGDATPINLIGLEGPTAGAFKAPLFIAVGPDPSGETDDQFIFVTDGDSVKIFDVDLGIQTGTIAGPKTHLNHADGIALSGPDLYVVSQLSNSVQMFRDFSTSGGNIEPKVNLRGTQAGMNFPVGIALPQFTAEDTD
jgi:hypothetical protein